MNDSDSVFKATTIRLPLTKTAMMKLALSLQELAQDGKEGYVTLDDIVTHRGNYNFIFTKDFSEKGSDDKLKQE